MSTEKHVFVADDDPMIRHIVSTVLKSAGFGVHSAASGHEAVTELQKLQQLENLPSMAFIDLQLIDMNGAELAEEVRKLYCGNPVRIVILSAHSEQEARLQYPTLACDAFVQKPFTPQQILAAVNA